MPPTLVPLIALAPSIPGMPFGGGGLSGALAAGLAVPVAGVIYSLMFWGQRSSTECSWREDDQIGLKVILGTLIMVGTALFASGLQGLLHLLTTFSDFAPRIKSILPDLLVGAGVVGAAVMVAVPMTNHEAQPKVLRLIAGAIAMISAVATVVGLEVLLSTLFNWSDWHAFAGSLTSLITAVVVFGGSGYLYAQMIGIEVPEISMPESAAAAPAQQQQYQQPQQAQQQQQYQQPAQAQQPQQAQQQYQQPQQGQQQQQQYQQPQQGQPAAPAAARPGAPPRPGGYPPPPGGGGYPPGGGGYPPT